MEPKIPTIKEFTEMYKDKDYISMGLSFLVLSFLCLSILTYITNYGLFGIRSLHLLAISIVLGIFFVPIRGYQIYAIPKRHQSEIYGLVKSEIMQRKQQAEQVNDSEKCEIRVDMETLKERYPTESNKILLSVLDELFMNDLNLFVGHYFPEKKSFYYIGCLNRRQHYATTRLS